MIMSKINTIDPLTILLMELVRDEVLNFEDIDTRLVRINSRLLSGFGFDYEDDEKFAHAKGLVKSIRNAGWPAPQLPSKCSTFKPGKDPLKQALIRALAETLKVIEKEGSS